jgi:hypothetical protein
MAKGHHKLIECQLSCNTASCYMTSVSWSMIPEAYIRSRESGVTELHPKTMNRKDGSSWAGQENLKKFKVFWRIRPRFDFLCLWPRKWLFFLGLQNRNFYSSFLSWSRCLLQDLQCSFFSSLSSLHANTDSALSLWYWAAILSGVYLLAVIKQFSVCNCLYLANI